MIEMRVRVSDMSIDKYSREVIGRLPSVIKKHALNIAAVSASNAPVDTGLLKNTLAAGVETSDSLHATVSDDTEYGVFHELGTGKGISAKHFLGNACEKEADPFFDDVKEVLKG